MLTSLDEPTAAAAAAAAGMASLPAAGGGAAPGGSAAAVAAAGALVPRLVVGLGGLAFKQVVLAPSTTLADLKVGCFGVTCG
jgi:hypothetical protein